MYLGYVGRGVRDQYFQWLLVGVCVKETQNIRVYSDLDFSWDNNHTSCVSYELDEFIQSVLLYKSGPSPLYSRGEVYM